MFCVAVDDLLDQLSISVREREKEYEKVHFSFSPLKLTSVFRSSVAEKVLQHSAQFTDVEVALPRLVESGVLDSRAEQTLLKLLKKGHIELVMGLKHYLNRAEAGAGETTVDNIVQILQRANSSTSSLDVLFSDQPFAEGIDLAFAYFIDAVVELLMSGMFSAREEAAVESLLGSSIHATLGEGTGSSLSDCWAACFCLLRRKYSYVASTSEFLRAPMCLKVRLTVSLKLLARYWVLNQNG